MPIITVNDDAPITGKYGEPRKYRVEDCPHDGQRDTDSGDYFCEDCGLRSEGSSH